MHFAYSPQFRKKYKKLSKKITAQVDERLLLLATEPYHPQLQNHKLHGVYSGYRSINVSGDLRIIYKSQNGDLLLFALGPHTELYD